MTHKLIIALVTAGICWTADAYADDTTDDIRCLVVSMNMAGSQNPTAQVSGTIAAMYWMGRLDGRTPDLDMESRIMTEVAAMKPELQQAEAVRCGTLLQGRGKALTAMGQDMLEKSKALMQQENSR